jgi:acetyl-CoA acetyltransferase
MVLVCGLEKMSNLSTSKVTDALMAAADSALEQRSGITFPSIYAMMATSHFHKHGSTEQDLALVAVKNHENAKSNPKAHIQKSITVEDVLASRPVAWPLKLLDCSPISDGAAVAVLTRPDLAAMFEDPVYVDGSAVATDTLGLYQHDDICWSDAAYQAAHQAYRMAHLESESVDLAELHDCFTINEIILSEACGFAPRGKGHTLLREGITQIGGKIPINTSGGLKARGHPTGATGVAQLHELYLQLRGEASERQVHGAEVALALNEGGSNATVTAHVVRR